MSDAQGKARGLGNLAVTQALDIAAKEPIVQVIDYVLVWSLNWL